MSDKAGALNDAMVKEALSDRVSSRSVHVEVQSQENSPPAPKIATTPSTDHVFRTVDKGIYESP